jgi:hypothetical protein
MSSERACKRMEATRRRQIIGGVGNTAGAVSGGEGLGDTSPDWTSAGLTAAGSIPGVGELAAGLSLGWDLPKAAGAYAGCRW